MSSYDDLIPDPSPSRRRNAYDDLLPGGAPAIAVQPAEDAELPGVDAAAGTRVSEAARLVAEDIAASRPARMTMTRGGQPQVVLPSAADTGPYEDASGNPYRLPNADWDKVGKAIIPGAGAQIRSAVANLDRMANEENVQGRSMVIDTPSAYPAGNALPHAVQRGIERQRRLLEQDLAARPAIEADAKAAARDYAEIVPKDMDTLQKAVFSAGTSAPTTLAGLMTGIVTRNPAAAMLIAGGGGSTVQAGSTYGEAREKGASHRNASIAATIDGAIEGLDALPVGIALKPGSSFLKRLAKVEIAEPLTEGAQTALQEFRAMAMEDPDKTVGEVWEQVKVAMLAGGISGPVHAVIGEAANAGQKQAAAAAAQAPAAAPAPVVQAKAVETPAPAAQAPAAPVVNKTGIEAPVVAEPAPKPGDLPPTPNGEPSQLEDLVLAGEALAKRTKDLFTRPSDEEVLAAAAHGMPAEEAPAPKTVAVPATPLDQVTDDDINGLRQAARVYAKEHFIGSKVLNDATGWDIHITGKGVKHGLGGNYDDARVVPVLPEMLKGATYQGSEPDAKKRVDIKAVHIFESAAQLAQTVYRVRLVVRETKQGRKYYDHVVVKKETPDGIPRAEGTNPQVRSGPASGAVESVPPKPAGGKGPKSRGMPAQVVAPPVSTAAAAAPVPSGTTNIGSEKARPDAIRAAMRKLFGAPLNEKGLSKKYLGIYKIKPQTVRLQNRNDLRTAAHEIGHHISNLNRAFRKVMRGHQQELVSIAPRAYIAEAIKKYGSVPEALKHGEMRRHLIEEGFAEFIAEYMTAPVALQAKVPGFHAAFEAWLKQNPTYAAALDEVQGMVGAHQALGPAEKILAKVGAFTPSIGERAKAVASKDTWDTVTQAALDKWHPLKLMVADLAPGIATSKNPYVAARMLPGDAAVIEDWVTNFTSPYDYQKRLDPKNYGESLKKILEQVMAGGEQEVNNFKAYLIARRAAELIKVGKENLFTPAEIAAGLKLETQQPGRQKLFEATANAIYKYNDQLLDYAVEGGLLSQEVADKFKQYANYIPFFREPDSDTAKPGASGNPFKRLTGGTANVRDPIANLIQNTANIIHATNRNAALRKTVELAQSVPGGGRWLEKVKVPQEAHELATKRIVEQLQKQGVKVDTSMAQGMADMQTFFTPSGKGDDRTRTVVYKDAGELKAAQVNDPLLWKALSNLPPLELDFITKILAFPARTLRAGVVLDPTFMVRNFVRDTLSATIQSKGSFIPVLSTAQGIKAQAQNSDAFKLWRSFGGSSSSQFQDPDQAAKVIERMAKRGGFDKLSIVSPMRLLEALEKVGSFTEYGSRIGEFQKTYKPGDFESALQAAFNSREVSTDFGMRGGNTALQVWTRLVPFMNPAMQGLYKTGRVLSGADGKATAMKAATIGTAMALASMLLALSNSDEDWYQKLEEWEKSTYWHFKLGGQVWRIPKPFEYGMFFASIPEALALRGAGKENAEDFKKRMMQVLSQVTIRAVPQIATALAEPWANKSFFTGRKIVPDRQERLEPGLQANPNTSKVAQVAGEKTNVSPAMIDNAVRNVFGTLGVHAETVADLLLEQTGAFPKGRERGWQTWPAIKAFVRDPDNPNTKQQRDFFEQLEKYRTAMNSVRELKARGEEEKAQAYSEEKADEIALAKSAETAAKRMAKIRKAMRAIEWDRDMSPAEKRESVNDANAEMQGIAEEQTLLYQAAKNFHNQPAK